jgi:hypothetical protein
MATRTKKPERIQRTVQMLSIAAGAHRRVTKALKETPTVVATAAVIAFELLPVDEQLKHVAAVRRQHVAGV